MYSIISRYLWKIFFILWQEGNFTKVDFPTLWQNFYYCVPQKTLYVNFVKLNSWYKILYNNSQIFLLKANILSSSLPSFSTISTVHFLPIFTAENLSHYSRKGFNFLIFCDVWHLFIYIHATIKRKSRNLSD